MTSRNLLSVLLWFCDYDQCVTYAFKHPHCWPLRCCYLQENKIQNFSHAHWKMQMHWKVADVSNPYENLQLYRRDSLFHWCNSLCCGVRTAHWQCLIIPGMPTGMKRKLLFSNAVIYNPNIFHSKFHQRTSLCRNTV